MRRVLAALYGAVMHLRNVAYDRRWFSTFRSALPVLCVGNVTVGGNGKTPLVLWIAERLIEAGYRPVILSRGYGGSDHGPRAVDPHRDSFAQVGDEPVMMARRALCPVVIARNRVAGAQFIERKQLGNVIVLDDGYQHRALERDLNLVCVAAGNEAQLMEFTNGELLPAGTLREPLAEGMQRADALVLQSRGPHAPLELSVAVGGQDLPVFRTRLQISVARGDEVGRPVHEVAAELANCIVVTGVANADSVVRGLEGITVREHRRLADHAENLSDHVHAVLQTFPGTAVVVTEKDAVKLSNISSRVWILKVTLEVQNEQELLALILSRCSSEHKK